MESDRVQPSQELLRLLADRLGVDPDQLLPAKLEAHERLARYKRAQAFFSLHHYDQALPLLLDCLPVPHPAWNQYDLHIQIATCYHRVRHFELSVPHYETALEIAIREGREEDVLNLHIRSGEADLAARQWSIARHRLEWAYREGKRHPERLPSSQLWVTLCHLLARAHQAQGQYTGAIPFWREAQMHLEDVQKGNPHAHGATQLRGEVAAGLGAMYVRLGNYQEAEAQLRHAEELFAACWLCEATLGVRIRRGRVLGEQGQFAEALAWLSECRSRSELHLLPVCIAQALREMANLYRTTGQWHDVRLLVQEALQTLAPLLAGKAVEGGEWMYDPDHPEGLLSTSLAPILAGKLYCDLAAALAEVGEWELAREQVEQGVVLLRAHRAEWELIEAYQLLSTIAKELQEYETANACLLRSQELLAERMSGVEKSLRMIP